MFSKTWNKQGNDCTDGIGAVKKIHYAEHNMQVILAQFIHPHFFASRPLWWTFTICAVNNSDGDFMSEQFYPIKKVHSGVLLHEKSLVIQHLHVWSVHWAGCCSVFVLRLFFCTYWLLFQFNHVTHYNPLTVNEKEEPDCSTYATLDVVSTH